MSSQDDSEKTLYERVFPLELQSWYQAVTDFGGEVNEDFVYDVLELLYPSFKKALSLGMVFDVLEISLKLTKAAKYLVDERLIAFKILNSLPHPSKLSEDEQYALAQIIEIAEKQYKGTLAYMERKWQQEKPK
jgi:hypothetical protein